MWTISALKERARERKKTNRWKMILVALILTIAAGTNVSLNYGLDWLTDTTDGQETVYEVSPGEDVYGPDIVIEEPAYTDMEMGIASVIFGIALLVVLGITLVILIPICFFLLNPLLVGGKRFFYQNIREDAQVKEICFSFDNHYMNSVKILFFRDLYTILWSLLFIIPGIVKGYEYRMIPYILAEHPDMEMKQAFALSREMMDGNKWRAFLFDLSFLGWRILSALTLGILGLFYVDPYYHQADAMLYDAIKYDKFTARNQWRGQPGNGQFQGNQSAQSQPWGGQ